VLDASMRYSPSPPDPPLANPSPRCCRPSVHAGDCKSSNRINTLGLREKSIPPGGEMSVALTRYRVTCGSKLELEGFFPFSVLHYLSEFFIVLQFIQPLLGNPTIAAHVAVNIQYWTDTVKQ